MFNESNAHESMAMLGIVQVQGPSVCGGGKVNRYRCNVIWKMVEVALTVEFCYACVYACL